MRGLVPLALRALVRAPAHLLWFLRPVVGTGAICVLQALLGPRVWVATQLAIVAPAPGPLRILRVMRIPLLGCWSYGLGARIFAHAHWRSLQFWKRVIPIYASYKRTQVLVRASSRKDRERLWAIRHAWGAEKVYSICVQLRGFYLKDGQFLGSRSDFIPAAWCAALQRLQDRVPPVPFRQIERTLKSEYCVNRWEQLFRRLDSVPIASATIAQVHHAELLDGTEVALKAQYLDQEQLCTLDLLNLKRLANYLQKNDMSFFDMQSVVKEFENQIPTEFDFIREAVMMTLVRENLGSAGIESVVIPRAIPGLVSRKSLCMTFVEGCRPDNTVALKLWGIKPYSIVQALGEAYGQMLLVDGLAHCDPHFGNIIVKPDGRVALIDFGQTKEIPQELRKRLCSFYLALYSRNSIYIMKTFGDLGIELDIPFEEMDDKLKSLIPVYANGLLDTGPLPPDIEINPFSADSPLNQLPIKHFNPDLFMVLRTMGLLRALCTELQVPVAMSSIFWTYAFKGLWRSGPSDAARKRRAENVRSALVSRAASPFSPFVNGDDEYGESCQLF